MSQDLNCVKTRYGTMAVPAKNDLIANSLRAYGEWAQNEIDILLRFIRPGDTVLDVGSCYGSHARAFSEKVGSSGHVLALDASYENFQILQENAGLSGIGNIEARWLAVADAPGHFSLVRQDENEGGSQIRSASGGEIKATTIDRLGVQQADFIKLDIEGMEYAALMGARDLLARSAPVIFAEANSVEAALKLCEFARGHDYESFALAAPAFNPNNFNGASEDMFGGQGEAGMIMVPLSRQEEIDLANRHPSLTAGKRDLDVALALFSVPQIRTDFIERQGGGAVLPAIIDKVVELTGLVSEGEAQKRNLIAQLRVQEQELQELRRLTQAERKASQDVDVVVALAQILRSPVVNASKRMAAQLVLKFWPGLTERRKGRLRRSIAKRDCQKLLALLSGAEGTVSPTVFKIAPIRSIGSLGNNRSFGRLPAPQAPEDADWGSLQIRGGIVASNPKIDVIIPVYKGVDETLRCIHSVLSEPQSTPFRVLVVNDCSPEARLSAAVRALADRGLIELIENNENLGFVKSCNLAMELNPRRDVLLLNSDTEVYGNWLDRIVAHAARDLSIGTLTPFSNNATICSYPVFCEDNPDALEVDGRLLDKIAAAACSDVEPTELPTGVGFCMYIRRECLKSVGLFDAERFGKGYGEENDLCLRIAQRGWRNSLAPDVFVRHWGGVSFAASSNPRKAAADETVARLHPDYNDSVARFIQSDPILPVREKLDEGRLALRAANAESGARLFVTHDLGGGTETHVQDLRRRMEAEGISVFICRRHPDLPGRFYVTDPGSGPTPNLPLFSTGGDTAGFTDFLRRIGVTHVHIHHLIHFGENAPEFFRELAQRSDIRVDFTVHDYHAICPRITLMDESGVYCGEPGSDQCQSCLDRNGAAVPGVVDIIQWRRRHLSLLEAVNTLYVPSRDTQNRLQTYLRRDDIAVREHPTDERFLERMNEPRIARASNVTRRKIGLVGAIGPHKGSQLLLETARAAQKLKLPLDFVVVGYTDRDKELERLGNVKITGPYRSESVLQLIRQECLDLAWLPSLLPETFSYTLTEVVIAGIQPVVFDLGAQASRVRDLGWGAVMPRDLMRRPEEAARFLADCELASPNEGKIESIFRPFEGAASYYG